MTERPELRIGTRERELAMAALDEHLRDGRLEATEYAERSAVAATARVRSELDALFVDLPEPHPVYPAVRPSPAPAAGPARPVEDDLPTALPPAGAALARHAGTLTALAPVIAFALFALSGFRFPFVLLLVPVAIGALAWVSHRYGR